MTPESRQIVTALQRLALFWRASQWQAAGEAGLNPTQGEVLQRVSDAPARAADLAPMLGISAASLSDSISALVAKGLVRRDPDPDDRRARRIGPTDAGRALAARLPEVPAALAAAIGDLDAAQRGSLLRGLLLLIRALQEAGAIPVQRMCATCRYFRPHVHDDPARPHHCAFVDAPFGDAALRLDCAEHETATAEDSARHWARLLAVG